MKKNKQKKKRKYHGFWVFVRIQAVIAVLVVGALAYYNFGGYADQIAKLKEDAIGIAKSSTEADFKSAQSSVVFASDGSRISVLKGEKDSYYLTSERIPYNVTAAVVSIEDKKFYKHSGVDYKAIVRAAVAMVQNGEATQGGSTITQQLARNIYLNQEKTWQRKMEEIFLARELEKKYSKDQILEFYLNNIYFGNGYYGIQAASLGYFNVSADQLDLSQTAFLIAVPNNPTYYDPLTNKEHTIERRNRILKNMLQDQIISGTSYDLAVNETIELNRISASKDDYVETYSYYCATRALMEQRGFEFRNDFSSEDDENLYNQAYADMYAECQKELYTGGYRIYTSINPGMETMLQESIDQELEEFTETGEEGVYTFQSAGVCIDNDNGFVTAIVGGRSQEFDGYTLNRAYQSYRQPGSAIKPLIVFTPALERGYTPDSIVTDEKIEDGPANSGGGYAGDISFRTAVAQSKNTVAWKLLDEITPATGLSYLKNLEFSRIVEADNRLTSALGGLTKGVSPVELTSGFAALENDGVFREPTCIMKITDAEGNTLYEPDRTGIQVYKSNAARMMTDMMKTVMESGTGKGLDLGTMPCAGKTGTTNDKKDGWFVGYTKYYTTGIWVGYDMPKETKDLMGNTYPGHIWQDYMEKVHEGMTPLEFLPYLEYGKNQTEQQPEEDTTTLQGNQEGDTTTSQEPSPQETSPQEPLPEEPTATPGTAETGQEPQNLE